MRECVTTVEVLNPCRCHDPLGGGRHDGAAFDETLVVLTYFNVLQDPRQRCNRTLMRSCSGVPAPNSDQTGVISGRSKPTHYPHFRGRGSRYSAPMTLAISGTDIIDISPGSSM